MNDDAMDTLDDGDGCGDPECPWCHVPFARGGDCGCEACRAQRDAAGATDDHG